MELYFLILLFVVMIVALGSGFPVAFALPGASIITIGLAAFTGWALFDDNSAFFIQDGPVEWLTAGVTNFRGIYWEVERDTLIAIPLFIFMGIMLQRSKIAEDLLVTMAKLFGPVPGGLGISVVVVGALLAATTGIVGATVVAMGLISLPAMMRNNYSPSLATGTICASGTLGQIIPPSIVLIILADQLASAADQALQMRKALYKDATGEISMPSSLDVIGTSAGDMFLGAFLPGMVLVGLYLLYILGFALLRPSNAPPVHNDQGFNRKFFLQVIMALVPPFLLIFVVLGSIIMGVATVNQAGAIGAVGATIMAGYRLYEGKGTYRPAILALVSVAAIIILQAVYDLNIRTVTANGNEFVVGLALLASALFLFAVAWSGWRTIKIDDTLKGVMIETAKTTSLVFIILLGAAMLTSAFRGFGGEHYVKEFLTTLPGGFWTQFIVVMLVVFIMGFFLDFIEIAVVVVPIVAPILLADPSANVTAVWLGVMIGLNIQTSFLTPPFGFALFYLRGVADKTIKTLSIYKGVVPFILLQLGALGVVGYYPELVNYLPNRSYLGSFNAPPPKNPKLEACIDEYLLDSFAQERTNIEASIASIKNVNFSLLPDKQAKSMAKVLENADKIYPLLNEAKIALDEEKALIPDYRPIHTRVRELERDIRREVRFIEENKRKFLYAQSGNEVEEMEEITLEIQKHEANIAELEKMIPPEWEGISKKFRGALKKVAKADRLASRAMAEAYEPVTELVAVIDAAPDLEKVTNPLATLVGQAATGDMAMLTEQTKEIEAMLAPLAGGQIVRSDLSKARRIFDKNKQDDREKAIALITSAQSVLATELDWRKNAAQSIRDDLAQYAEDVRLTIGLRSLSRVPKELVTPLSNCQASHRDISLFF